MRKKSKIIFDKKFEFLTMIVNIWYFWIPKARINFEKYIKINGHKIIEECLTNNENKNKLATKLVNSNS